MVLINPAQKPNPAEGYHFFDSSLPGLNSVTPPPSSGGDVNTMSNEQNWVNNTKYRKPYTKTKSRECWSDHQHEKFLEALHLFDRDWKKIEAFVGSKTVTQIRSHAQKYFHKVQKSGTSEHVPPPRPKRKASHPYPHKAPKNALVPQISVPSRSPSALLEPGRVYGLKSSTVPGEPVPSSSLALWNTNTVPAVSMPQVTEGDVSLVKPVVQNCCHSSVKDSSPKSWSYDETISQGDYKESDTVLPDISQVCNFIGSIFDPNATDHLQRLNQMHPINRETALLWMRNLAVNLMSPEFESYRKLLSSYNTAEEGDCW